MIPSKRLPYVPIIDRPPLKLPAGVRLVVWPVINVEVWDIGRPMPRQVLPPPTHITRLPDVAHWAWHEYGMRVGYWRLQAMFDELGISGSLFTNGRVCQDYPQVAEAALKSGWEFVGHSWDQQPTHVEKDQRAMIRRTVKEIKSFTGKAPVGWLSPGLTETLYTPDYLAEAGIDAEVGRACRDGPVGRKRERRLAEWRRIDAQQDVMHDRVRHDRHVEHRISVEVGLVEEFAHHRVQRRAYRLGQFDLAARIHHHVGNA